MASNGLFISYRRQDAEGWAGRLTDSLRKYLPKENIFRDIDDIPPGKYFDSVIHETLSACRVLIVLIGPNWLEARDAKGRRRIDLTDDFVRIEIASAIKRGILIVPALVGGAQIPDPDDLPEDCKELVRRNAIRLMDDHWTGDVQKLVHVLEPVSVTSALSFNLTRVLSVVAVVAILCLLGVFIYIFEQRREQHQAQDFQRKQEEEQLKIKQALDEELLRKTKDEQQAIEQHKKEMLRELEEKRQEDAERLEREEAESLRRIEEKRKSIEGRLAQEEAASKKRLEEKIISDRKAENIHKFLQGQLVRIEQARGLQALKSLSFTLTRSPGSITITDITFWLNINDDSGNAWQIEKIKEGEQFSFTFNLLDKNNESVDLKTICCWSIKDVQQMSAPFTSLNKKIVLDIPFEIKSEHLSELRLFAYIVAHSAKSGSGGGIGRLADLF